MGHGACHLSQRKRQRTGKQNQTADAGRTDLREAVGSSLRGVITSDQLLNMLHLHHTVLRAAANARYVVMVTGLSRQRPINFFTVISALRDR